MPALTLFPTKLIRSIVITLASCTVFCSPLDMMEREVSIEENVASCGIVFRGNTFLDESGGSESSGEERVTAHFYVVNTYKGATAINDLVANNLGLTPQWIQEVGIRGERGKLVQALKVFTSDFGEPPSICIKIDFEISIHNSNRMAFPEADLHGCRFHLGQAWSKRVQALDLPPEYQKKGVDLTEITDFFIYIFCLSFLHPEGVSDFFAIDLAEIKPVDERVTQFYDYLVDNYISENSTFPPHLWAEHSSSLQRTTSPCESFHSKYNILLSTVLILTLIILLILFYNFKLIIPTLK